MSVKQMSDFDLGWVCALFDGEGCFALGKDQVVLKISQVDQDNIQRLLDVTGVGVIRVLKKKAEHYQQAWLWAVGARSDVKELTLLMYPHLCLRRQRRADECLALITHLDELALLREAFFKCGHAITDDNTYLNPTKGRNGEVYITKRCKICTQVKSAKWQAGNKERRNERLRDWNANRREMNQKIREEHGALSPTTQAVLRATEI